MHKGKIEEKAKDFKGTVKKLLNNYLYLLTIIGGFKVMREGVFVFLKVVALSALVLIITVVSGRLLEGSIWFMVVLSSAIKPIAGFGLGYGLACIRDNI